MSEDPAVPHPRETLTLYGHIEAEHAFLDAYRGGRMPHAWLIGGARGIGKATLAYRMARFVFAHPDPAKPAVQNAESLALAPDNPAVRRVAAQGHSDLLALERVEDDKGKLRSVIQVDDVRRTIGFFGSTAGEGGWRVCIVDSADELNAAGANALLKILEEPPAKSLLLVVSHAPGRLLPTIRSRCRRLALRPLSAEDAARALADALSARRRRGRHQGRGDRRRRQRCARARSARRHRAEGARAGQHPARRTAGGEPARPACARRRARARRKRVCGVRRRGARLAQRPRHGGACRAFAAGAFAEVWDRLNKAAREVEIFHLERKPMVFNVFGWLAEASRG